MGIKAIVLDMDGTLLTSEKKISPKTKEALLDAQKNGVKVILASGRPTLGMWEAARELELAENNGFILSYNGSMVTDCTTNEVLFNQPMSIETGQAMLNHLKQFDVIPMIVKDTHLFVNDVYNFIEGMLDEPFNVIKYEAEIGTFKLCEMDDLAAFADFPLNKILVAGHPDYLEAVHKDIHTPFADTATGVFSAPFYFELTAKDISKAHALHTVLASSGIKAEEVISFGDSQNDRSIIDYAGIGVAMGNATDEIKGAADHITLSNDEDGIAVALEKFL